MEDNFNYSSFSAKCASFLDKYPINLRELCITKSTITPKDFFKCLEETVETERVASAHRGSETVEEYAQLFQVFETYPSNLQKLPKKRELQRTNSVIFKANETHQDQMTVSAPDLSLVQSTTPPEEEQTAVKVYNDYKKFLQKLQLVQNEASALEKEQSTYLNKVAQLEQFAQQLSKLMPSERNAPDAFTADEQAKLGAIAKNMQELNYMSTQSVINLVSTTDTARRLETLVEVLNYALAQLTS